MVLMQSNNYFHIGVLSLGDINNILHLQELVIAGIKNTASYYPLSYAETSQLLDNRHGYCLGAFDAEDELIAFAAACFPGMGNDNLGLDLGFENRRLEEVAHLEVGIVHPEYRRQGLQIKLYRGLLEAIRQREGCRYVLSTVAPDNYPALANSLKLDLLICKLLFKYNQLLRFLLFYDLTQPARMIPQSIVTCPAADLPRQQELLNQGFYGFDLKNADEPVISYGKMK